MRFDVNNTVKHEATPKTSAKRQSSSSRSSNTTRHFCCCCFFLLHHDAINSTITTRGSKNCTPTWKQILWLLHSCCRLLLSERISRYRASVAVVFKIFRRIFLQPTTGNNKIAQNDDDNERVSSSYAALGKSCDPTKQRGSCWWHMPNGSQHQRK